MTETWKALNITDYPIELRKTTKSVNSNPNSMHLRSSTVRQLKEWSKTKILYESFVVDAAKLWNKAPEDNANH